MFIMTNSLLSAFLYTPKLCLHSKCVLIILLLFFARCSVVYYTPFFKPPFFLVCIGQQTSYYGIDILAGQHL
jgi:hypothetical protein